MASRLVSSSSFLPPRRSRALLVVFGALFLAQGVAKGMDAAGYMAALDRFHLLQPAALAPLSLGALALAWTVLEMLAAVAMLYGGLSRTPAKQLALGGVMLALGISGAYLALDIGAIVRHLPIENCTSFGSYLPQELSWLVVVAEGYGIALLAWLFMRVLRWPSLEHVARHARPRSLSVA